MNEQERRIHWIIALVLVGCMVCAFAQEIMPAAPGADDAPVSVASETEPVQVFTPGSEEMIEPLGEPVVSPVPDLEDVPSPESPAVQSEPAPTEVPVAESVEVTASAPEEVPVAAPAEPTAEEVVAPPVEDVVSEGAAPAEFPVEQPGGEELISPEPDVASEPAVAVETPVAVEPEAVAAPVTESVAETVTVEAGPEGTAPLTEAAPATVLPDAVSNAEVSTVGAPEGTAPAAAVPVETAAEPSVDTNVTTELIEIQPEGGDTEEMVEAGAKENLISISLDNVPLQDVMRMFARISGANIVSGTNLQGNITVNLKDVEWQPALRTILDTAGMTLVMKSPGIYSVVSKSEAASAPVTIDTIYLKYTTVTNVLPVIQKMLISSNASVASFASANALVVQETSERLDIIKNVVEHIDKPRPQVFIEAKFVELDDEAIKDLGVNWSSLENYTISAKGLSWSYEENRDWLDSRDDIMTLSDNRTREDIVSHEYDADGRVVAAGSGRVIEDTILQGQDVSRVEESSFIKTVSDARTAVLSASDFALTLSALKQQAGASVVSNPRIVVASGETATIHVGRKDPNYVTKNEAGAAGGTVQTTRELSEDMPFVDTGVQVAVRPVVNTESNITVRITPKLSRVLAASTSSQPGDLPPISSREINSEFNVEAGRTVAIGGLTQTDEAEKVTKIPILGDIPIIGKYLFSHTHSEKSQSEVIIFITIGMAGPETMTVSAGIPSEGRLIHRHLAQQAAGAAAPEKASTK